MVSWELKTFALTDELLSKGNVSDEEAELINLSLQHVNVVIRYHNGNWTKAMTLTSLQGKVILPPQFKHDADKKIKQLKEFVLKSEKYKDLSCDCHLCETLKAKAVEPILRSLLLECLFVDLSDTEFEFRDNTGGQVLMKLVNFAAIRIGIKDLEVHLQTAGEQIAVTVQRGKLVTVYNANPDLIIKTFG